MDIKLVVMDWAGTTVDYGCFAPVHAFEKAFLEMGIQPTMQEIREPMGLLKKDHIRKMLQMQRIHDAWIAKYQQEPEDADVEKIYEIFEKKLMESLAQYTDPKEGCLECVRWLKSHDILIGSTTGYTHAMMQVVQTEAAKKGYEPDLLVTPEDVGGVGRPAPYMIFRNMQELGVTDVRQVIKVGDTVSDMKEGKNAGVFTVGVLEGSSVLGLSEPEFLALSSEEKEQKLCQAKETLLGAGADMVISNLHELPKII
ncbi:MAG: phosphonoacetaldehyde hydrolase [Lachnospiraceae bacterium]|nr:phosphonoacetaldehyde hydrolase [Lachnospiraceae bacterium]